MWDAGKTVPIPGSTTTMPVSGILTPGGTLSPDGSRFALVHANGDAVTLIDTARPVIGRTVSVRKEAVNQRPPSSPAMGTRGLRR